MSDYRNPLEYKAHNSIHLVEEGKPLEALKLIEDVLRVAPEDPEFINIRASALHEAGRSEEALEELERCLKSEPDDALYLRNKGLILYDTDQYDEAIKTLQMSLSKDSSDTGTTYLISSSYLELENYPKALEFANRSLKIDPKDADSHYLLYRIYDSSDDHSNSMKELQAAIKYDPENIKYCIEYARNLFEEGNREKALQELEKLTTKMGSDPEAHSEKIELLFEVTENYEAAKACDYAIRKWPDDPDFLYMKSVVLSDDGIDGEALETIDRAIAIRKEDQYEEVRVQLLGDLERYGEVIESVSKNPNLLDLHFDVFPTYVEALIKEGQKEKSVGLVKDHIETMKSEDIMNILGIYASTGSYDDAVSICDHWYEKSENREIPLLAKFSVLLISGKVDESIAEVRSHYGDLTPEGNANTQMYVARKLYGIGEYGKALEELNTEYDEHLDTHIKDDLELTRLVLEMKINGKDQGMEALIKFVERVGDIEVSAMIWEFMQMVESEGDSFLYDLLNNVMPADDEGQ